MAWQRINWKSGGKEHDVQVFELKRRKISFNKRQVCNDEREEKNNIKQEIQGLQTTCVLSNEENRTQEQP